jgi:peptide/nickel transport system permease protein
MTYRKARLKFTVKRIRGFISALARSKRGLFGVAIILIAVVVALAAPLLTPYDPLFSYNLAGDYAQPAWARYLPGGGGLTQNMVPVNETTLLQSPNVLKAFNVTVTPSNETQNVVVQTSAISPVSGGSGSLEVVCQTSGLPMNSNLTIQITRDFYYPYSGIPGAIYIASPGQFWPAVYFASFGGVAVSPSLIFGQNWPTFVSPGVASYNVTSFPWGLSKTNVVLPGPISYSQENVTGQSATISTLKWVSILQSTICVFQQQGPGVTTLDQLFPGAGSYKFGIQLTLTKVNSTGPNAQAVINVANLNLKLLGSSWGLLGTDSLGRDVFTQLVYGTRISLEVGLVSAVIGTVIGLIVGLVAAYLGGIVDEILMRFTDALLVLPGLPLMIVLITVLSNGVYNLNIFILVIGFMGWMGFARVVRSQVLSLKERPYVEAAKAVGAGTPYILWRHILPNVVVLIYVTLALSVPSAIVTEAAFSFLGFIDLSHMSWGRMLNAVSTNPYIWWIMIPPGLAIAILSLSFIMIGYAIDDILNPRLRTRR